MKVKLFDFVKCTDFNKYYFLINSDEVIRNSQLHGASVFIPQYQGEARLVFNNLNTFNNNLQIYDLGKCLNLISPNADIIAKVLDTFGFFEVAFIEHENDNLYIHLKVKNKEIL